MNSNESNRKSSMEMKMSVEQERICNKENHIIITSKIITTMSGLIISAVFQTGSHALKNRNISVFLTLKFFVHRMRYAVCR